MGKPVISLYDLEQPALIVPGASCVIYSNQAGGNYCLQPEAEGVLIPLRIDCGIEDKFTPAVAFAN